MRTLLRALPIGLVALLFLVGTAAAQTSQPPVPTPPSTQPPAPPSTTAPPAQPSEPLDLPLEVPEPPAGEEPEEPTEEEEEPPTDEVPPTIYGEEVPTTTESIFYVIDISGSMDWGNDPYVGLDGQTRHGTPLDRAKAELVRSIQGLARNFRFNIIAFDCSTRQWRNGMQEATPTNKQSASAWSMALVADGATGTGPACAQALGADRENRALVLLSDGSPNCIGSWWGDIPDHRNMILGANTQGARIHCFGIGAYGEMRQFMQSLSSATGGRYVDVN